MNTLIVVGVIAAVGYFAWTQCWFNICNGQLDLSSEEFNEILPGLFQGGPPISQENSQKVANLIGSGKMSVEDYNKLPTIGTTKTSNYRSTRASPKPTVAAVKAANYQQNSLKPGTKGANDFAAQLRAMGYKPPSSGYAFSMFADTIHNPRRLSA